MDIQFIVDDYACVSYYQIKSISLLQQKILDDIKTVSSNITLREIGAKTLGAINMSAPEAAWIILGLSMSESSIQVKFIQKFHPDYRLKMLKT
ncbi:hypothetical protein B4U80_06508 [Leptotrombidium deliense]|uniref:Uncharacterized protein n=1 Tax=Leptotrombidium deliense TaxID=299467 RepID=A0A443RS30_9ACAR|nr:hypothetical protein B4U80_06508 [Leptotrombidium deliense]